ncbi:MAG TPA: hypothetical protein VF665_06005 [Longimicrobium sp.]|jgi:hypothetical protein|uniref:hypothetical protein n=1 Tax=Longimicrobium sp. TaxID=2029185 RepID=UPI002EDA54F2
MAQDNASADHVTVTADADYDVTFHPAFASRCTVSRKDDGSVKELYKQDKSKPVNTKGKGHPKRHVITLRGKGRNGRNLTITVDDPNHSLHSLSINLYDEGRNPEQVGDWSATETFTVENSAATCPPHCTDDPPPTPT